jgi:hypothetical protein
MTEFLPGHGEPWDDGSVPWSDPYEYHAPVGKPGGEPLAVTDLDLIRIGDHSLNQWFMRLTHDEDGNQTGHWRVPCSRYARTGEEAAWWAIALQCVYLEGFGQPDDPEAAMDGCMSAIVNDHDGAAELLRDYLYAVPPEIIEQLGGEEEIRRIVGEHVPEES